MKLPPVPKEDLEIERSYNLEFDRWGTAAYLGRTIVRCYEPNLRFYYYHVEGGAPYYCLQNVVNDIEHQEVRE